MCNRDATLDPRRPARAPPSGRLAVQATRRVDDGSPAAKPRSLDPPVKPGSRSRRREGSHEVQSARSAQLERLISGGAERVRGPTSTSVRASELGGEFPDRSSSRCRPAEREITLASRRERAAADPRRRSTSVTRRARAVRTRSSPAHESRRGDADVAPDQAHRGVAARRRGSKPPTPLELRGRGSRSSRATAEDPVLGLVLGATRRRGAPTRLSPAVAARGCWCCGRRGKRPGRRPGPHRHAVDISAASISSSMGDETTVREGVATGSATKRACSCRRARLDLVER